MDIGETLEARNADDFAEWLAAHGQDKSEIWVVLYNKASGKQTVTYPELVEVGVAYGWIDSMNKGMDEEKYAQRFSPRRERSNWTDGNKAIARRLIQEGRMTAGGKATLPEDLLAEYDHLAKG